MAIRIVFLCLAIIAFSPARLHAEGDNVMNWRIGSRPAPVATPRSTHTYRARRRYDPAPLQKPDDAALGLHLPEIAISAASRPEAGRTKVLVIGDSLADALVGGLEADPGVQADLVIRHKTVSASGLVRSDFHDWPASLTGEISAEPDLAAIIVMVGLNDRQAIREGTETLEPLSEAWTTAYRGRIDRLIQTAQNARRPLFWVGLPVVRSQRLSTYLMAVNDLARERVVAAGETFIETYENFADETGKFAASGPDIIGDTVRLRGADGIHFTPAGQRKLAFFVDKPLRRRLGDRIKPKEGTLAALLRQDIPAGIAPQPDGLTIPLPAPASVSLPKPRPAIGETRPLIEARTAASLISRQARSLADPATHNLFDRGLSPAARQGRSDDFRWKSP
jgi:uncharacterized protein